MSLTGTVYVELPSTRLEAGEVVLAVALNLLPAELRIELGLACVTHEPSRQQTDYVTEMCRRVAPDHPTPWPSSPTVASDGSPTATKTPTSPASSPHQNPPSP